MTKIDFTGRITARKKNNKIRKGKCRIQNDKSNLHSLPRSFFAKHGQG